MHIIERSLILMRENKLWRKICAHVLSVFLILSVLGTALPGIGEVLDFYIRLIRAFISVISTEGA